jgi:hypothetical protein
MRGGSLYSAVIGVTSVQIAVASPRRRRITFHPPANNRVTISQDPPVVLDAGPTLQQSQAPLTYDYEDYGDVVCGQFFGIANVAGVTIGITEAVAP